MMRLTCLFIKDNLCTMAAGSRNIIKQLNEDKTLTTSLNLLFPFPTGEYLRVLRNMKDAN